jgi:hypothetical protein
MSESRSAVAGQGERIFSDGCYKKFVLDGVNSRIYRRRIDLAGTLCEVVGAAPGGARAEGPKAL